MKSASTVVDRIRLHADAARVRQIPVPEWGTPAELADDGAVINPGVPLVIHYNMVTLDDLALVHELDGPSWQKQAPRIVAMKSLDEAGNNIFRMTDAIMLRTEAAPHVVNRIALAMLGGVTIEDAEKN